MVIFNQTHHSGIADSYIPLVLSLIQDRYIHPIFFSSRFKKNELFFNYVSSPSTRFCALSLITALIREDLIRVNGSVFLHVAAAVFCIK